MVKYLISQGFSLDDIRTNNNEALRYTCRNGHLEVVKYLIAQGLTLDDISTNDNEALKSACKYGHLEIVEYLKSFYQ